jgi:hypothetical protein
LQNNLTFIQHEADATYFVGPCETLHVAADHFQSVASNPCPGAFCHTVVKT